MTPAALVFSLIVSAVTAPVRVKDVAVAAPRTGVTSVGDVARTGAPVPVAAVMTGAVPTPPPTRIFVVSALRIASSVAQFASAF